MLLTFLSHYLDRFELNFSILVAFKLHDAYLKLFKLCHFNKIKKTVNRAFSWLIERSKVLKEIFSNFTV